MWIPTALMYCTLVAPGGHEVCQTIGAAPPGEPVPHYESEPVCRIFSTQHAVMRLAVLGQAATRIEVTCKEAEAT